jgi:hypothetical protein
MLWVRRSGSEAVIPGGYNLRCLLREGQGQSSSRVHTWHQGNSRIKVVKLDFLRADLHVSALVQATAPLFILCGAGASSDHRSASRIAQQPITQG